MFLDSSDEVQDLSEGQLLYFKQFHECEAFQIKNIKSDPNWSGHYFRVFK